MVVVAGWTGITSCAADSIAPGQTITYVAQLGGANELPGVATMAAGTATFTLLGSTVQYVVSASGFATTLNVGHIHIGGPTAIGPVIVPFTIAAQTGVVATGSIDLSRPITFNTITISGDSLRTLFNSGQAYVNLHTSAAPGGEIRGQIVRQ